MHQQIYEVVHNTFDTILFLLEVTCQTLQKDYSKSNIFKMFFVGYYAHFFLTQMKKQAHGGFCSSFYITCAPVQYLSPPY